MMEQDGARTPSTYKQIIQIVPPTEPTQGEIILPIQLDQETASGTKEQISEVIPPVEPNLRGMPLPIQTDQGTAVDPEIDNMDLEHDSPNDNNNQSDNDNNRIEVISTLFCR